ncbi:hypothetical protein G6011_11290 [Alternaria panax]|uniref:Uncharacterized protein n=1 Tax=Alternaria panax TaxID=48097 RepID=A0AAD4IDR1_9PLEO|nr:hypothetical protein G6011_11290 [Alternaria panax]
MLHPLKRFFIDTASQGALPLRFIIQRTILPISSPQRKTLTTLHSAIRTSKSTSTISLFEARSLLYLLERFVAGIREPIAAWVAGEEEEAAAVEMWPVTTQAQLQVNIDKILGIVESKTFEWPERWVKPDDPNDVNMDAQENSDEEMIKIGDLEAAVSVEDEVGNRSEER